MANSSFDEHLKLEDVMIQLKSGTLFLGLIRVNGAKRKTAYVTVDDLPIDVIIDGERQRNRAIHGDVVAVKLLPEGEWISSTGISNAEEDFDSGILPSANVPSTDLMNLWKERSIQFKSKKKVTNKIKTEKDILRVVEKIKSAHLQPKGEVVFVAHQMHKRTHVGALAPLGPVKEGRCLPASHSVAIFCPSDPRYPHLVIPRMELPEAFKQDPVKQGRNIYVADIRDLWPASSKLPFGQNVRSIGQMGCIHSETESLLTENGVDHGPFLDIHLDPLREILVYSSVRAASSPVAPAVIAAPLPSPLPRPPRNAPTPPPSSKSPPPISTAAAAWTIPKEEISKRRDLRQHRVFTIDPSTAKDLDDALHITQLDDGTFEIGCHIADVSFFLSEGTALDLEAKNRATSVYLVQKVVPMLPSILCEDLCSLNPNVDRLAFSCIWRMNQDGTLIENSQPWFGRTVIRSCAKLDYATAQRIIDGDVVFPNCVDGGEKGVDVVERDAANMARVPEAVWESARCPVGHSARAVAHDVKLLHSIAVTRRQKRLASGALVLNRGKLYFELDAEGNPCSVGEYKIQQANQLIEEYMLIANFLVAQKLLETVGVAAFLRYHPAPKNKGMCDLQALCESLGHPIDISTSKSVQTSLSELANTADDAVRKTVSVLLMHAMKLAEYTVAFSSPPQHWRHYALNIPYYTHFTSPIRRYADVVVHRLLDLSIRDPAAAAELWQDDTVCDDLEATARQCNEMRKAAKSAQEQSDRVFLAVYLMRRAKENNGRPLVAEGVVIGIGEKSFTVEISDFCFEERLFVDAMDGVTSTYDNSKKIMTLTSSEAAKGVVDFESMTVSVLSRVRIALSVNETPPISIRVGLVGPSVDIGSLMQHLAI